MSTIDRAAFLGSVGLVAAATGAADAQAGDYGKPHPPIVAEDDPAIVVARPRLQRPDATIGAYAAMPKIVTPTTPGVVLVCHVWGVDAQYRDMARRLAKAGYIAIAPGLFDRYDPPSGDAPTADIAVFSPIMRKMLDAGTAFGDIGAARAWIAAQAPKGKIGLYGNCGGGATALQALANNPGFAAASILYGNVRADRKTTQPPPPDAFAWASKVTAAVIGAYGADDAGISWDDVQAAYALLPAPHDVKLYPGAAHAFMDDTRSSYRPGPAADAWARQMAWFSKYLTAA